MSRARGTHGVRPLRGFTLVEIAMVLIIMGVLVSMGLSLTRVAVQSKARSTTTATLERAQDALIAYVQAAKRLPCPADGRLKSADAGAGVEIRTSGACPSQQYGVLPWATLGMNEPAALDGYEVRITYRVAPSLVADDAMRLDGCDPAGAGSAAPGFPGQCAATCVDLSTGVPAVCTAPAAALAGVGLTVQSSAGPMNNPAASPPTGAAFVLISHGEDRVGGYGPSGVLQEIGSDATPAPAEVANGAGQPLQTAYTDDPSIDDVLLHPTVLYVVNRAGLGPRAHRPPAS